MIGKILFIMFIIWLLYVVIAYVRHTNSSHGGLTSLPFIHLEGFPNLPSKKMTTISSNGIRLKVGDYTIPHSQIRSKKVTSESTMTEHQKSVIKRALVGGAIAGVAGAVVGGVSGAGSNQTTQTNYFFNIEFKDNDGIERNAIFYLSQPNLVGYLNQYVNGR